MKKILKILYRVSFHTAKIINVDTCEKNGELSYEVFQIFISAEKIII